MYFLDGTIEIFRPSRDECFLIKTFARLGRSSEERDLALNGYGSWTLKRRKPQRGAEPDECYVLSTERKKAPDFAIEVEWSRGGLDKLEIYRKLGVREVWMWSVKRGITVHALRDERPLLLTTNQTKTARDYRAKLRRARRRRV